MDKIKFKNAIYQKALVTVDEKLETFKKVIHSAKESRKNETKSSVGDKYETGRALLQSEIQRNEIQLAKTQQLKNSLYHLDVEKQYQKVEIGSLVLSSRGNFFIGVGLGKLTVEQEPVFMISLASPIGKTLLNKKAGDKLTFQGKEFVIKDVI